MSVIKIHTIIPAAMAIALAAGFLSCSSGNSQPNAAQQAENTASQTVQYDSALCEQLVSIPGNEMSPDQLANLARQTIVLADEMNSIMEQIISQDMNEASIAQFKQMYTSRKFQMAQQLASELYIDTERKDIPEETKKQILLAQDKGQKMQETFQTMYLNLSGAVGSAADPAFYQER